MKIAILHSGNLTSLALGGVDRYIKSLISFCNDYEITVFGTTKSGEYTIGKNYVKEYGGKKYTFIPISDDKHYPLSLFYMIKEFFWVNKLDSFDCIYAQRIEFTIPFMFSNNKKKLFQIIHGSSRYSVEGFGKHKAKVHLFLEKISIKVARRTYIILNRKEFGTPYYKEKYSNYADKIFYAHNPIDTSIFNTCDKYKTRYELKLPINKKIMLFSGRIENNPKRVFLFPLICEKVINYCSDFLFIVVGEGSDREYLQLLINEKGLTDNFVFTGYIEDSYLISKYYNAADASINISSFEGTCTSILESIACNTPVISTDVGDIHECIIRDENGIIIANEEKTIVEDASNAFIKITTNQIRMNKVYEKYRGEVVVEEFKKTILEME